MILGYLLKSNIILVISLCYPWFLDISVYQTSSLLSPSVIHDPWIFLYVKHYPCYLPLSSMILGYRCIPNIILVISVSMILGYLCIPHIILVISLCYSILGYFTLVSFFVIFHILFMCTGLSPSVIQDTSFLCIIFDIP